MPENKGLPTQARVLAKIPQEMSASVVWKTFGASRHSCQTTGAFC